MNIFSNLVSAIQREMGLLPSSNNVSFLELCITLTKYGHMSIKLSSFLSKHHSERHPICWKGLFGLCDIDPKDCYECAHMIKVDSDWKNIRNDPQNFGIFLVYVSSIDSSPLVHKEIALPNNSDSQKASNFIICRHFQRGHCKYGNNCTFLHGTHGTHGTPGTPMNSGNYDPSRSQQHPSQYPIEDQRYSNRNPTENYPQLQQIPKQKPYRIQDNTKPSVPPRRSLSDNEQMPPDEQVYYQQKPYISDQQPSRVERRPPRRGMQVTITRRNTQSHFEDSRLPDEEDHRSSYRPSLSERFNNRQKNPRKKKDQEPIDMSSEEEERPLKDNRPPKNSGSTRKTEKTSDNFDFDIVPERKTKKKTDKSDNGLAKKKEKKMKEDTLILSFSEDEENSSSQKIPEDERFENQEDAKTPES
jgi:hypothetical protein